MSLLSLLLWCTAQAAPVTVPDYRVRITQDPASKVPRFVLEFTPPPGNHFNLGAPMKVGRIGSALAFKREQAKKERVRFSGSSHDLAEGQDIESSLFLCDEKKTYCIKKVLRFPLKVEAIKEKASLNPIQKPKKDGSGFFVNDPSAALSEAVRLRKPLLVDFFGIWCPPCNLYNENVFPSAPFKKSARNFVLLKIDADDERFFPWKAHFKVGGYPTLLVTKAPESEELKSLLEVDRIVGFFPPAEFALRLDRAYRNRDRALAERIDDAEGALMGEYAAIVDRMLEQKDQEAALKTVLKARALRPLDAEFRIRENALKDEDPEGLIREILPRLSGLSEKALLLLLDRVLDAKKESQEALAKRAWPAMKELETRVSPETLMLPGLDLSLADLLDLKRDLYALMKDEAGMKAARTATIEAYRKLLKVGRDPDSRGIHLELAALLFKNGEIEEARSIYARFLKRFPEEFTFHHAAAGMHLELKELKEARSEAELAVRYAYGDNLIRAMERLVRIMALSGEKDFALKRAEEFLGTLSVSDLPGVRTARYVASFKKTLESVEKGELK
jgi:thiol-disulfide isomerase/thioredoxin